MRRNDELAKELLKGMTEEQKDLIYSYIRHGRVMSDIETELECQDPDINLTESQIDKAAELYVYLGEYDCNKTYWSNIDNVIELVRKEEN